MKRKTIKIIEKLIVWLQSIIKKISRTPTIEMNYSSLSPVYFGEEDDVYAKSLLWALQNRKEEQIRNIAVTGPYGSGKSSVLKTFQKNHEGKEFCFLPISLATFTDLKNKAPQSIDRHEFLRLIETSIVQQIVYREKDESIPDSRFKRIKHLSKWKLFRGAVGIVLYLFALIDTIWVGSFEYVFEGVEFDENTLVFVHYLEMIIILLGTILFLFKAVRFIRNLVITKLKIQDLEIGIENSLRKSVLNQHLDEILYFFSVCPYNVVVIEDLDRFEEAEIFTKLRELNLLLNNSKKSKHEDIVFIYAVRDDMFTDVERTKFFDFIVPIIPVINSSNSADILTRNREKFGYNLTDEFIGDVSYFLQDMRLIQNITNEFELYKSKLDETLNQDKLFAILIYKNLYPKDFVQLCMNDGMLYSILSAVRNIVATQIKNLDEKIATDKRELELLRRVSFKNVDELRKLYLLEFIRNIEGFSSFTVGDNEIPLLQMTEEGEFDRLKSGNLEVMVVRSSSFGQQYRRTKATANIKFSEIENAVDPNFSYNEREQQIFDINDNKQKLLRARIVRNETEKIDCRHLSLAELLSGGNEVQIPDELNKGFISILLRKGYLAEDYLNYVSLFHGEIFTREDHKFVLSAKNQERLPVDYRLPKPEKVILQLTAKEFGEDLIFNYDLIDYLIGDLTVHKDRVDFFFRKLGDGSAESFEFMTGYIEQGKELSIFIQKLFSERPEFWPEFYENLEYPDEKKWDLYVLIIKYADVTSITELIKIKSFKSLILADPNFLQVTDDKAKLQKIISDSKLEFTEINFETTPESLLKLIYQQWFYKFNYNMLSGMIHKFGKFDEERFDIANYSSIVNSEAKHVIDYVKNNMNEYLDFYFSIKTNVEEDESSLIEILNNESVTVGNKEKLIESVTTKIVNLESIEGNHLFDDLLNNNRIVPSWKNVNFAFNYAEENAELETNNFVIPDALVEFLNLKENAEELTKTKAPMTKNEEDKLIYANLIKKLLLEQEIVIESFEYISKASPWWYEDLEFEEQSIERMQLLIKNIVINPTIASYENIKKTHPLLRILLIETFPDKFLELGDLSFDGNDLEQILYSKILTFKSKLSFVSKVNKDSIISNSKNLAWIVGSIVEGKAHNLSFDFEYLQQGLTSPGVPKQHRVALFNDISQRLDWTLIPEFLNSLGGQFAVINDRSRKAKIPNNPINRAFLEILKKRNVISSYSELKGDSKELRVNHKRT